MWPNKNACQWDQYRELCGVWAHLFLPTFVKALKVTTCKQRLSTLKFHYPWVESPHLSNYASMCFKPLAMCNRYEKHYFSQIHFMCVRATTAVYLYHIYISRQISILPQYTLLLATVNMCTYSSVLYIMFLYFTQCYITKVGGRNTHYGRGCFSNTRIFYTNKEAPITQLKELKRVWAHVILRYVYVYSRYYATN